MPVGKLLKKIWRKKIFFASSKSMKKVVGSGAWSICQRYGSGDPDPHQNVTDPQHCIWELLKSVACLKNTFFAWQVWEEDFADRLRHLHVSVTGRHGHLLPARWTRRQRYYWTVTKCTCCDKNCSLLDKDVEFVDASLYQFLKRLKRGDLVAWCQQKLMK